MTNNVWDDFIYCGSETWGPNISDLQRLHRSDRSMMRWIWGIKDRDETPFASLLQKLVIIELQQSFAVSGSDGLKYSVPSPVSILSQAVKRLWRMWSVNVTCLALIRKRDTWRTDVRSCLVLPTPSGGTRRYPRYIWFDWFPIAASLTF